MKQISFAEAEHQNKQKVTRREQFLAQMDAVVPWQRLIDALSPFYYQHMIDKQEDQSISLELMLRVYLLQQWYNLADETLADVIYDSSSMCNFIEIDLDFESVPDTTALLRFHQYLQKHTLTHQILKEINASLAEHNLFIHEGAIVEAAVSGVVDSTKKHNPDRSLKEEDARLLIDLGILDSEMEVTPEAYVAAIDRKPVDEQARLLGLSVIICPDRNSGSPEAQFKKYFGSRTKMYIDGGESYSNEGYCIKSLFTKLIPDFRYRSKRHNFSAKEIDEQVAHLEYLTDIDIVRACEAAFPNNMGVTFKFIESDKVPAALDKAFFQKRFRSAKCQVTYPFLDESDARKIAEARSPEREKIYIRNMLQELALWHSLEQRQWKEFASVVLKNWSKVYAGWPDLTFFSPDIGLALVEIKGKDKIHASQVFTLLTLKRVLGPERLAIGWVNSGKINFSGQIYKAHMAEVVDWFNTPSMKRLALKERIYKL